MTREVSFATPYGRSELLGAYRQNWFLGMMIAIALHALMFGAYYACTYASGTEPPRVAVVFPRGPIDLPPPSIPRSPVPPSSNPGGIPKSSLGSPVPVPDAEANPETTLPRQDDFRNQPSSESVPGSEENFPAGDLELSADEAPPPDFVPVEKDPLVVRSAVPAYPDFAVRAGIEGTVWVKMWVGADGRVRQALVTKSETEILNEAALEAARKFLFTPAYMNSGPVSVWVTVPFRFKLSSR